VAQFNVHSLNLCGAVEEDHEGPQSEQSVFRPTFEPSTFRLQVRSVAGFEVLTAVVLKSYTRIFWNVTTHSPLKVNRRLG
jgi:hypothetical protein